MNNLAIAARSRVGYGIATGASAAVLGFSTLHPSEAKPTSPRPMVICGPSGVGKGTLISRLMKDYPNAIGFSVSHTTRKPRPGEIDGVHYHFTNKKAMEAMVARGEFVEWANVHGNLYGTSKRAVADVSADGKVCVLDIDVQGARSVANNAPELNAFLLFVLPPTPEELERRLRSRGTETEEAIQKRLANSAGEVKYSESPIWHARLINSDVDVAYALVKTFVENECMP